MHRRKTISRRSFLETGVVAGGLIAAGGATVLADSAPLGGRDAAAKVLAAIGRKNLESAVRAACTWLADVAQVRTEKLTDKDQSAYHYDNWKGASRDRYSPQRNEDGVPAATWRLFGTVWHTGQAVKALSLAYRCLDEEKWLTHAKLGAEFIRHQQNTDPQSPDFGCVAAFEDAKDALNTSAVLEACDGLLILSDVSGDRRYADSAVAAVNWAVDKLYKGDGHFHDGYDPQRRKIVSHGWRNRWNEEGRPLIDDGVLLKAWKLTGREKFRTTFFEIADKLLKTEDPPGNWMGYLPCAWKDQRMHPRQAFWWGRPMWMAYKESGQQKYRDCFDRACQWYVKAMRRDGGMLRATYTDFNTTSFGHATSGTGAACMMFRDQYAELGNERYLSQLILGLKYMLSMQLTRPSDPNLRGAIIEKVLPPDGTDAAPWFLRDIGTTFFVASACQVLLDARAK